MKRIEFEQKMIDLVKEWMGSKSKGGFRKLKYLKVEVMQGRSILISMEAN